jgi:membrane-associated protease RseP (regulator of RpoE activity)
MNAGIMPGDFIIAINGQPNNDLSTAGLQPFQVVNITIWRNGETMLLPGVKLGETIQENTQTGQNTTSPYLGVSYIPYQQLTGTVSSYLHFYSRSLILYVIPPAFPGVAYQIPFSAQLSIFYTSPLGSLTPVVENVLFWLFFVNFNLSIFNNLPIYPMDGGQALDRLLVGVGRGKINDDIANRVTMVVTLLLAFILVSVVVGPYLSAYV